MGQLIGRTSIDRTCMAVGAKNSKDDIRCTDSGHTFFEVKSLKDINLNPNYSGIMGVAPDDPMNGPSFVAKLKNEGIIS